MSEKTEAVITNETGKKIAKAMERIATAREQLVNSNAIAKLSIGRPSPRYEMDRIADTHRRLKGGYRCLQEQPKCLLSPFRRGFWRRWRS